MEPMKPKQRIEGDVSSRPELGIDPTSAGTPARPQQSSVPSQRPAASSAQSRSHQAKPAAPQAQPTPPSPPEQAAPSRGAPVQPPDRPPASQPPAARPTGAPTPQRRSDVNGVAPQKKPFSMDDLLIHVHKLGGSDLHITVGKPPMVRVHGKLAELEYPVLKPQMTHDLVYSIMTDDKRKILEDTLECDFSHSIPGVSRFRVNVFYQRNSVGAAIRLISVDIKDFESLGLPPIGAELVKKPRGFVLVTGPTGSGKSSTLAAMIDVINQSRDEHIMTIEDPIEFLHSHKKCTVNQREIGADTGSFSNALKHVLRQDPDVILVGEMRDLETIGAALTAAETGHLVFATLHTQDAPQTIDRIIDVFPSHQQQQVRVQLAGTLQGILCQQLLPTKDEQGRAVAVEVLIPNAAVRNLIREAKTHQIYSTMQTGQKFGMKTMDQALADLYSRGVITKDQAMNKAGDPENLRAMLEKGLV